MAFTTLISTAELAEHLTDPTWVLVDCRFDLAQPKWGEQAYLEAHIPGAVYAHLERDLSGQPTGQNGRHPLPDLDIFKIRLGRWGIGANVQVVAYDQHNGAHASRLWWLLRYLGHNTVAVLDGGLAKWQREGRAVRAGDEQRPLAAFSGAPVKALRVVASEVERLRQDPAWRVVDARAPERFRGEVEPIDPVAGHIPGAVNHFHLTNVQGDNTFLAPAELRAKFQASLGDVPSEQVVAYCGSGVTAAHLILAMEVAGLSGARLYAGSWSEWIANPNRAIAKGG